MITRGFERPQLSRKRQLSSPCFTCPLTVPIGGYNKLMNIIDGPYVIWSLLNDNHDRLNLINCISRAKKARDTFFIEIMA
ncbi:hypothetical protein VN97_g9591 [Penicillium thymicola]|uniref:Uncharacterized protein n=1 Tax=Penicillium thymicola TaxID=293382 RepID=A0AAI9TBE5_PENTH|nr:hypothetical protein VN97_g9591 [Penicillium thymicola]